MYTLYAILNGFLVVFFTGTSEGELLSVISLSLFAVDPKAVERRKGDFSKLEVGAAITGTREEHDDG